MKTVPIGRPDAAHLFYPNRFRRGSAVAKVAIARKLAVRLFWKLRKQPSPVSPARMQGSSESLLVGGSLSS
jgi:hypothetical protein